MLALRLNNKPCIHVCVRETTNNKCRGFIEFRMIVFNLKIENFVAFGTPNIIGCTTQHATTAFMQKGVCNLCRFSQLTTPIQQQTTNALATLLTLCQTIKLFSKGYQSSNRLRTILYHCNTFRKV